MIVLEADDRGRTLTVAANGGPRNAITDGSVKVCIPENDEEL